MPNLKSIFVTLTFMVKDQVICLISARDIFAWPVGQAVKTPPFHGGNTGSSPVRVILII